MLRPGGFACPRCCSLQAQLPSRCHVCGLTLVSSPHLARSYHHLFPVKPFAEVDRHQLAAAQVRGQRCRGLARGVLQQGREAVRGSATRGAGIMAGWEAVVGEERMC